jgi:uncharacterized membrane protein
MVHVKDLADTWASLYANSAALRTGIGFAHVAGLVAGGGAAIAADRGTLAASRSGADDRRRQLDALRNVHHLVLSGLALVIVSGALLCFADLDTYLHQRMFWFKMGCFVVLMVNGTWLLRVSDQARTGRPDAWRALRRASVASLVLWFGTTLLGAALPNVL